MKKIEIQVNETEKFGTHFYVGAKRVGYIGRDYFNYNRYRAELPPRFDIQKRGLGYEEAYDFVREELESLFYCLGLEVEFVKIN